MKTDKFDDAIRRKLESIEPPFRERDWSHMQAFMHHHGYPPAWVGASQWLVPMAAAAAVTGLIISTVWQFHTNQQLSQSVQTLNQTVARLETTQAKLIKIQTQTDTVYVTNFTKNPALANPTQLLNGQPVQRASAAVPVDSRYALRPASPAAEPGRPTAGTETPQPSLVDNEPGSRQLTTPNRPARQIRPAPSPADQPLHVVSLPANTSAQQSIPGDVTGTADSPGKDGRSTTPVEVSPNQRNTLARTETSRDRRSSKTGITSSPSPANRSMGNASGVSGEAFSGRDERQRSRDGQPGSLPPASQGETRQIETIALLNIRPLIVDSAYYVESMTWRTRRIRSLLPAVVAAVPTTNPVNTPTEITGSRPNFSGVRVRLGVAGEISSMRQAMGIYSEVVIGKHISVGIGLNRISWLGGQFADEDQFDRLTHTDFRKTYTPGIPLIHDITNIDRQFTIWQLPVNLSYRALLGKGYAIMPAVGMDFSLSAQDNTTFTYRRGFEFPNVAGKPQNRPCESFNAYTVAVGAEKSWKHIVIQAGPVLSLPTRTLPDPINPVTLSLRTRVLFQF